MSNVQLEDIGTVFEQEPQAVPTTTGGAGPVARPDTEGFTEQEIARGLPGIIEEQNRAAQPVSPVLPVSPISPVAPVAPVESPESGFTPARDARNTIRSVLQTYGLGNLSDYLYNLYANEEVNIENPDALLFAIRDTNEYKTRFAANSRRASKGLPELDPGSYLALENQYRDLMRSNGLPLGFYDQISDFEKLIEGDVSPSELQSRISNGYRQVADADPEVKRQMRELYNVDEAGLTAYFLDPERAAPLLERQARAAQIAARGREQGGIQLGAMSAEELVARGFTPEQAQEQFVRMGQLAGLYQEMGGEDVLSQQEKIGAAFGYDVAAQQKLEQRRAQRVGEFKAGGQFARTTGATSGTVVTGAGEAQ